MGTLQDTILLGTAAVNRQGTYDNNNGPSMVSGSGCGCSKLENSGICSCSSSSDGCCTSYLRREDAADRPHEVPEHVVSQAGRKGCTFDPAGHDPVGGDSAVLAGRSVSSNTCDERIPREQVRTLMDEIMQGIQGTINVSGDDKGVERSSTMKVESNAQVDYQEPHIQGHGVHFIEEDADEGVNSLQQTRIRAAMDSGSCRNVTHPKTLPAGTKITPNTSGKHFSGAGGEVIEKYGGCMTNIESTHGQVGCKWHVADVTRPLHSVSQIAGPYDGAGNADVLFNNRRCVVVSPGVVEAMMQHISPIAEYHRDGNLYLSDFTMSDFVRPGQSS